MTRPARGSTGEQAADNRSTEVRLLPGRFRITIDGTKVLAAAHLALNQAGEGSSPSGPTVRDALVVQRRRSRPRKAGTWVRVPPGALRLFDNPASALRAHDVAVAYCLAMAEVRVRLPLGTSENSGRGKAWPIRLVRDQENAGSNPAAPTGTQTGVACAGTCASLLKRSPQVRFLPPVLYTWEGKPMGDGSRFENGRAMSLGGSTPPPSASIDAGFVQRQDPWLPTRRRGFDPRTPYWHACPWPSGEAPASQVGQAGSTPAGHSRGSANGRRSGFEPDGGGSNPPPRT
jgi:hypothetical protein